MKITRDNYESFFLDYLEGNLEDAMIDQFLDFLKQNPDLKEELHLFEQIHLPEEPIVFKGKENLYKSAESESFDLKAVAYMEGDLKARERRSFEASLERNPKLRSAYALMEKTRLAADTTIRYPEKEKLYKKSGAILWLNWMGKVAAVLLLLFGIYSLFQKGEETRIPASSEVASLKTPSPTLPQTIKPEANEPAANSVNPTTQTTGRVNKFQQGVTKPAPEPLVKEPAAQRERLAAEHIAPILARLESEPVALALEPIHPLNTEKINDPHNILTLDEYLALKARKATNNGILSASRLLRVGLNVASELSGDRLDYSVKNGKVASLGFESKLLAFEIPLEKNKE